jgi:hypothetical protein
MMQALTGLTFKEERQEPEDGIGSVENFNMKF